MIKPAKLIGRELSSLKPEEIEELMQICGIDLNDIIEIDKKSDKQSLHPKYGFYFGEQTGDETQKCICFYYWERGTNEYLDAYCEISVGQVWGWKPIEIVKWFLDNGWKWEE